MQDLVKMDGLGEPCEDAKASFWKKNNRAVPGRPSPKTAQRAPPVKSRAAGSTSFQDFQESISDAWDMGDDEFCIISGMSDTKISKRVSHTAALSVINTHRSSSAHINNSTNNSSPALPSHSDNITDCSQILPSNEKAVSFNATNPIASQLDSTSEFKKLDSNEGSNNPVKLSSQLVTRPHIPHAYPGRPQPMRCSVLPIRDSADSEAKLERFTPLLESNLLNLSDLRQLSWSGIPVKIRAITWRLLSGYLPASLERRQTLLERKRLDYWNLVEQYYDTERDEAYQDTYRQIHIDIPRMNPLVALFQQATVQEMFERILFIWAIRHPASGYVQGINDLVTPFFMVFLQEAVPIGENLDNFVVDILPKEKRDIIEADSFWCLSKFLDCIQDNYIFAQLGIQTKVNQLKELIQRIDGPLHKHLQSHGVDYLQFSFRWMNNLLTRELPLHCTIRLWDTYLAESDGFAAFQLYVCAAFLLHWRAQLMQERDFQGLMIMLQNLPTQNWTDSQIGILVAEAYRLKFTFADAPNHLQRGVVTGER